MAYNGSGTFSRTVAPYVPQTTIQSADVNAEMDDIATGLTNAVTRDGQSPATANLPMGGFRHTGVGNATARNHYAAVGQVQDGAFVWGGTAAGTADARTITLTPAITAYAAGQRFAFVNGAAANTGAATLAVNGLTAQSIRRRDGTTLRAGDLPASRIIEVRYDGTNFVLVGPDPGIGGTATATLSGTAVDFTGIPSDATEIVVAFTSLSTSGTSLPVLLVGDSTGFAATTYSGSTVIVAAGPTVTATNFTVGVGLSPTWLAASTAQGEVRLRRISGNTWKASGEVGGSNAAFSVTLGYVVTLSGTLNRVRLTTALGSDTFDDGSATIYWR